MLRRPWTRAFFRHCAALCACAIAIATGESATAVSLTIGPPGYQNWSFGQAGLEDSGQSDQVNVFQEQLATGTASQTITSGGNTSTSYYQVSNAGIEVRWDHARRGDTSDPLGNAAGVFARGEIYFSVDKNVPYLIEGVYTAQDPDGGYTGLAVALHDFTTNPVTVLLDSRQQSRQTPNESFRAGLLEGDWVNNLKPPGNVTSGTLLAGHAYHLFWESGIAANASTPSPATATGYVRVSLVPEPGTAALLATGLILMAAFGRRTSAPR